jgi:hypothetical protein
MAELKYRGRVISEAHLYIYIYIYIYIYTRDDSRSPAGTVRGSLAPFGLTPDMRPLMLALKSGDRIPIQRKFSSSMISLSS